MAERMKQEYARFWPVRQELTALWRSNRQTDMSVQKHHGSSLFQMTEPSLEKQHFIMKRLIKRLVSGGSMHIMRA